jgi:4-amino-4-deoxychorismate lyase
MCRLLETICLENGRFPLLPYHAARMQRSRRLCLGFSDIPALHAALAHLPAAYPQGLYKCRVVYARQIESVEVTPYRRPHIRSLRKVYDDHITYDHKYENRRELQNLYRQRGACDDILIIRQGWLTDTYIGNLLLYDGRDWWTPERPLLPGVRRQVLLEQGLLKSKAITERELNHFQSFSFINAMNPFRPELAVDIKQIS